MKAHVVEIHIWIFAAMTQAKCVPSRLTVRRICACGDAAFRYLLRFAANVKVGLQEPSKHCASLLFVLRGGSRSTAAAVPAAKCPGGEGERLAVWGSDSDQVTTRCASGDTIDGDSLAAES